MKFEWKITTSNNDPLLKISVDVKGKNITFLCLTNSVDY
jgi:hypothetical protein